MNLRVAIRPVGTSVSTMTFVLFACGFLFVGCGEGDDGKIEYSQKFDMPDGATINPNPGSTPPPTRTQLRRREEEADKEDAANSKSKRRRP